MREQGLTSELALPIAGILQAVAPQARWAAFTSAMAALGIDQINYGFLDLETAERMEAVCDPTLTTMRRDWIEHYVEQRYDLADHVLAHVRAGHHLPKYWTEIQGEGAQTTRIYHEAGEAGLRSGLLVPLAGPWGGAAPGAAMMIGSGLPDQAFRKLISEYGLALVSLVHLFHAGASGEILRRRSGVEPLSVRERDCLQYLARGLRIDAIADKLTLARVTVELHLRNARKKLRCHTLPEAVARASLYQQISL